MLKIRDSLKKLIGRLKRNMDVIALTGSTIAIPFGFTFLFIASQEGNAFLEVMAICVAVTGLAMWALAMIIIRNKVKNSELETEAFIGLLMNIDTGIHNLVNEIRQERNERNNKSE